MADAFRGSMDAAEYKNVVLGLILLKYTSDAFEEQNAKLVAEKSKAADPEDGDKCRGELCIKEAERFLEEITT